MSDQPKMRRPAKHSKRAMDLLGREWCGNKSTPAGVRESLYVKDDGVTRVFSMIDDGGFVGVGYPDQWQVIMRTKAARMFAWWVLRGWVADWFGLRTRLYGLALHAYVKERWKLNPYPNQARLTARSSIDEWRKERGEARLMSDPEEGSPE